MIILKMILRNAFRNKLRTLLTVLGTATAILAFGLLRTMVGTWYAGVAASSATQAHHPERPCPWSSHALLLRAEDPPGRGGEDRLLRKLVRRDLYRREALLPEFPRWRAGATWTLVPEFIIPEDQRAAFSGTAGAAWPAARSRSCSAGRSGDIITLKGTVYPGNWDLVLRAIYRGRDKTIDETQFFLHWDYVNESTDARRLGIHPAGSARDPGGAGGWHCADAVGHNRVAGQHSEGSVCGLGPSSMPKP